MPMRLPTYYLSHGGGPWPYMTGQMRRHFALLESTLKSIPQELGEKPKTVIVISGHWEEKDFALMGNPSPPMVYDYSGFPEAMYHIRYPAAGSPEVALRARSLIQAAGLATHIDEMRGFDHGTYAPLAVIYPEANIPVIQISIRSDYDPEAHFALGRALAPLRDEGILLIGSGSSYHNLDKRGSPEAREESLQFDAWLRETLVGCEPPQRAQRLRDWERAPAARASHPEEDHFMPLFVALGAAENEPAQIIYHEENVFGSWTVSSFRFGAPARVAEHV